LLKRCLDSIYKTMNDIIRKQIKDVIVPQSNEVIRRQASLPDSYDELPNAEHGDRIEKNPFFEKTRNKKAPLKNTNSTKNTGGHGVFIALLFVLIMVAGFFTLNYFASAKVEIEPTVLSANIDHDFTAKLLNEGGDTGLVFNRLPFVEEKLKEVPATIEKKLQIKASGKVKIFNEYSKDNQRLIKNTRLEDEKTHKIYRIDQSVVVPGMKVVNGKNVPGSVEALVYADAAGKEYNITEPADFTIPGFKGDPRYAKFKAMTIPGSQIVGGYNGVVNVPSDEAVKVAQDELKQDLKKIVVEKARAQIPDDMSLFPGSIVIKFEEIPQDYTSEEDTANVVMRATVSAFFIETAKLTSRLIEILFPENKNNAFLIPNLSSVEFKFIDPVDSVVPSDILNIRFHLSGVVKFVGKIDTQKIQSELAGKSKKEFSQIIIEQNNISKADAVIRPPWKNFFPSNSAKISIKIITK